MWKGIERLVRSIRFGRQTADPRIPFDALTEHKLKVNSDKPILPLDSSSERILKVNSEKLVKYREELAESVRELSRKNTSQLDSDKNGRNINEILQHYGDNSDLLSVEELDLLGETLLEGNAIISKDPLKAVSVLNDAIIRGSIISKYRLAVCIKNGVGISPNPPVAFNMLLELAENHNMNLAHAAARGGFAPALNNIGNMLATGTGVDKDENKAFLYFKAAADAGDPVSRFSLASCYAAGKGTNVDTRKAFELYSHCALQGHPLAMFNVGAAYLGGIGVDPDVLEASKWFEKAGEHGILEGFVNLGNIYRAGLLGQTDYEKAAEVFRRGAEKNDTCRALLEETVRAMSVEAEFKRQLVCEANNTISNIDILWK